MLTTGGATGFDNTINSLATPSDAASCESHVTVSLLFTSTSLFSCSQSLARSTRLLRRNTTIRWLECSPGRLQRSPDSWLAQWTPSGGFRGRLSQLRPPPLGRRTDAVTHGTPDIWQRYCIMATPSPFLSLQTGKTWYSEYSKLLPSVVLWQL